MSQDNNNHQNHFNASMQLPEEDIRLAAQRVASSNDAAAPAKAEDTNPAADMIRHKLDAIYADEPDAANEALDLEELEDDIKRSKHQQFLYDLTNSGKPLAEIQTDWHEYYNSLSDPEKHQVWQEFYATHAEAEDNPAAMPIMQAQKAPFSYELTPVSHSSLSNLNRPKMPISRTIAELKDYALGSVSSRKKLKPAQHFQSLLFGLGMGAVVILIFLFSFFNERFIAPFIQPSRTVNNTPIIGSSAVGSSPEIIIPKINVEIPVVYDVGTIDDPAIESGLERGVVHYATTPMPGQDGNLVIVGHSSNNIFNKGKYKFAFVLLSRLDNGDTFYIQKDGKRYTYEVYKKSIVKPTEVGVLAGTDKAATATLITCDPPGTSTNRLVVVGQQIDPDLSSNGKSTAQPAATSSQPAIIPGNSPSLWSRLTKWFAS